MSNKDLLALTGLFTLGDFSIKSYSNTGNGAGMFIGYGAYLGCAYVMINAVKPAGVAYVTNMLNACLALSETSIGLYQGEQLSQENLIGIMLIVMGAIMLRKGH